MSDEVAASSASRRPGAAALSPYSCATSQAEPIQTPDRAEGQGRGDLAAAADAARGQHRDGPTASTISGTSTMLAISPVWPPAS